MKADSNSKAKADGLIFIEKKYSLDLDRHSPVRRIMGIYHYKIELLPREYFHGNPLVAPLSEDDIDQGQNDSSGWWAKHPPSEQLVASIRSLLPIDQSWGDTEEFVSAGDWHSDVRIWKNDNRIWSIHFRFSPVADRWPLMQRFVAIARDNQCFLLEFASGLVFEPDEKIVQEKFAASKAMRFVRDPAGTIVSTANEIRENEEN
jgi:hypothetical protein